MVHFSGSLFGLDKRKPLYPPSGEKPRVLPAGASRVRPASLSAHDAVTVQKTSAHLREHRSDLHVMWSFQLARSHLHVMWSFQRALRPRPLLAAARLPCQ